MSPIDNIGEWPAGTPLTLTASVTNTNYQFWGWIIDGAPMGAMGQTNLTFTPTANVTVHAWFYAPAIDGNVDYLEYNTDSTIVTGVKEDYRRRVTSISIPVLHNGAVQEIAPAAFQGCTSLETLNLVPTVTTIGDYAFAGCTSLANIDVSNVTSFGSDAFYGCTALQGVTLSNRHGADHRQQRLLRLPQPLQRGAPRCPHHRRQPGLHGQQQPPRGHH